MLIPYHILKFEESLFHCLLISLNIAWHVVNIVDPNQMLCSAFFVQGCLPQHLVLLWCHKKHYKQENYKLRTIADNTKCLGLNP